MNQRVLLAAVIAWSIQSVNPAIASDDENRKKQQLHEINLALKHDPFNAVLHYRAALTYEKTSVRGSDRREVAKAGYAMAIKTDPSFWPARLQLGILALEDKDSVRAQRHLMDAALLNPREPIIFYALARAAYANGELGVARAAFDRASVLRAPLDAEEYVTGAAVYARSGDLTKAAAFADNIIRSGGILPPMVLSAFNEKNNVHISSGQTSTGSDHVPVTINKKMGMVDIIILRRDESKESTTGINLLEALNLQLGGSLLNSKWSNERDLLTDTVNSSVRELSRELTASLPSITYSLNIANARDGWSTIQAQQALLIYDEQTSKVSVGSSLTFATDGQQNSDVATKDAGLSLEIKPQFLDQGTVKVSVSAVLEDFVESAAGSFRQSVQTEKSTTDVTAELRFGETILIASGEATINSRAGSKTPLLGDLPLVGQLFSNKRKFKTNTSLLILMTLRPRGSEQVPHADKAEREMFQLQKDRLLEQLDAEEESFIHRFIPDHNSMSYQIDNPARDGDQAYLSRTGAFASVTSSLR